MVADCFDKLQIEGITPGRLQLNRRRNTRSLTHDDFRFERLEFEIDFDIFTPGQMFVSV